MNSLPSQTLDWHGLMPDLFAFMCKVGVGQDQVAFSFSGVKERLPTCYIIWGQSVCLSPLDVAKCLWMVANGWFAPWFNQNPSSNSSHSDTNCQKDGFRCRANQSHTFLWSCVLGCALMCSGLCVPWHWLCCWIDKFGEPRWRSGHLDLWKVMTMCISTDFGSEFSESCSLFSWGPGEFDQNAPQNNFTCVSCLWCAQTIVLVKHRCSWKLHPKTKFIAGNCARLWQVVHH